MLKGKVKRRIVSELSADQGGVCIYCNEKFGEAGSRRAPTLEHKRPVHTGIWHNDRSNLAVSCWECNALKGPLDHDTFIAHRTAPGRLMMLLRDFQARAFHIHHKRVS